MMMGMRILQRIVRRMRHLLFKDRFRRELDDEMAFHLEALTQDLVRKGMSPDEARREAHIRFGTPERVHQRSREERGLAVFDETARNFRHALRGLARSPLFASTFVLTLALCIGLGTAVFSVVDAVLWRPLPYPAPEQLAQAVLYNPSVGKTPGNTAVDGRTWERIRDEGAPLDRAVYSGWARGVNLTADDAAAYVQQQRVGTGYFRTLGITPLIGREFTPEEDVPDGPAVAMLSHALWTRTFRADPDMLGKSIRLKGEAHTVVGIMPAEFRSPAEADVWTPLRPSVTGEGSGTNYGVLVRIPDGMSLAEGDSRIASIEPPRQEEDAPDRRFGLVGLDETLSADVRTPLEILLGGMILLFVVGCANLAGLQIARAVARRSEMATRRALGSGSGALVRQAVVENLVLGILGGVAGLALAYGGVSGLETVVRNHLGLWQPVGLDGRSLGVALGINGLATFFFGIWPVLQASAPGTHRVLVSGSRVVGGSSHRLRRILLVGQVAMVTALLFGAGLLVRSYGYLEGLEPGFEPAGVLTAQYSLDDARYADDEAVRRLFDESLRGIREIPGVTSAAVSLTLPYERPLNMPFKLSGDDNDRVTNLVYVSPGFFETMRIPLLQGRPFSDADRPGEPVALIVNQAFADTHLEAASAVGAPIAFRFPGMDGARIVGVVGNVQQSSGWGGSSQPVSETPTVYLATGQTPGSLFRGVHVWFSPNWMIRTAEPTPRIAAQVTDVVRSVDSELPVARTATVARVMADAFARQRFEAAFLISVALFALLLAGVGLYGIVANEVLERRSEMGLRIALGATPGRAAWTTGLSGVRLAAVGLVLGAIGSVGVARIMSHLLYGVSPSDPVTMVGLFLVLTTLAATASFIPARRVVRMDPARILREETA
jgi:predicted permease